MIVVRLCGGMGNQLWQMAFGKALESLGNEVAYDPSYFDHDESRSYVLDRFIEPIRFSKRLGTVHTEPDLLYHPELLKKYQEDCTLDGYWQTNKYWSHIEPEIRKGTKLRTKPSEKTLEVWKQIQGSPNSTFLHVRRSDNLSVRGLAFHNVSPLDYYEKALRLIFEQTRKFVDVFVFSDDIEWCKTNLPFTATFVDHNNPGVDWDETYTLKRNDKGGEHEDLMLMASCQNAITATSSYSWWGAALGPAYGIKVSPAQWFVGDKNSESRDMIPWHRT